VASEQLRKINIVDMSDLSRIITGVRSLILFFAVIICLGCPGVAAGQKITLPEGEIETSDFYLLELTAKVRELQAQGATDIQRRAAKKIKSALKGGHFKKFRATLKHLDEIFAYEPEKACRALSDLVGKLKSELYLNVINQEVFERASWKDERWFFRFKLQELSDQADMVRSNCDHDLAKKLENLVNEYRTVARSKEQIEQGDFDTLHERFDKIFREFDARWAKRKQENVAQAMAIFDQYPKEPSRAVKAVIAVITSINEEQGPIRAAHFWDHVNEALDKKGNAYRSIFESFMNKTMESKKDGSSSELPDENPDLVLRRIVEQYQTPEAQVEAVYTYFRDQSNEAWVGAVLQAMVRWLAEKPNFKRMARMHQFQLKFQASLLKGKGDDSAAAEMEKCLYELKAQMLTGKLTSQSLLQIMNRNNETFCRLTGMTHLLESS
jgi:hypothetical protein